MPNFISSLPAAGLLFWPVYSWGRMSPASDLFHRTGEALCWTHEWLVLRAVESSLRARPLHRDFMPTFTPHQNSALKAVAGWLKAKPGKSGTPPIFRLFGYAGTGKTTLARHIADGVDGEVKFAAFTGKAALVMRNKGCDNASTIHSLIYRAKESGVEQPSFELWDDAPASKAKLIVIDECSMVDAELGRDLMSCECRWTCARAANSISGATAKARWSRAPSSIRTG